MKVFFSPVCKNKVLPKEEQQSGRVVWRNLQLPTSQGHKKTSVRTTSEIMELSHQCNKYPSTAGS